MPHTTPDLFDNVRLPPGLDEYLRGANPWWQGQPGRLLPSYRRWAFNALLRKLETGLAPAIVLRGARQVGKTTLLEQVVQHLVHERHVEPRRILRVQFDEIPSLKGLHEPILTLARWFESRILGLTLNEAAHARKPAYLFFDEAQNLGDWAPQIKTQVDHHTRARGRDKAARPCGSRPGVTASPVSCCRQPQRSRGWRQSAARRRQLDEFAPLRGALLNTPPHLWTPALFPGL